MKAFCSLQNTSSKWQHLIWKLRWNDISVSMKRNYGMAPCFVNIKEVVITLYNDHLHLQENISHNVSWMCTYSKWWYVVSKYSGWFGVQKHYSYRWRVVDWASHCVIFHWDKLSSHTCYQSNMEIIASDFSHIQTFHLIEACVFPDNRRKKTFCPIETNSYCITGCAGNYWNNNFRRSKWSKFCPNVDNSISVSRNFCMSIYFQVSLLLWLCCKLTNYNTMSTTCVLIIHDDVVKKCIGV